jgi:hypothetical protein
MLEAYNLKILEAYNLKILKDMEYLKHIIPE